MPHHCRFHRLLSILALGVFVIGVLGTPPTTAQAAFASQVFYASPDIVLLPDCSASKPCPLQTAVDNAVDGDTIIAKAGTYHSTADQVLHINKDIVIYGGWNGMVGRGMDIDPITYKTILDGENERRVVLIDSDASPKLVGMVMVYGYVKDGLGGGVSIQNSTGGNVMLDKCWVQNNYAGWYGGGFSINIGSLTIRNSAITTNITTYGGGAILAGAGTTVILENNILMANNADYGSAGHFDRANLIAKSNVIFQNDGNPAVSFIGQTGQTLVFENNLFRENKGAAVSGTNINSTSIAFLHNTLVNNLGNGLSLPSNTSGVIMNNIFQGNVLDSIYLGTGSTPMVSNNLFWENGSNSNEGDNAIEADALLDSNSHLTNGSPAINAGANSGITVDFDGQARPLGLPDIGADEFMLSLYLPTTMR